MTIEKEDKLIELLRERPCLFDISSKGYSNRTKKYSKILSVMTPSPDKIAQKQ